MDPGPVTLKVKIPVSIGVDPVPSGGPGLIHYFKKCDFHLIGWLRPKICEIKRVAINTADQEEATHEGYKVLSGEVPEICGLWRSWPGWLWDKLGLAYHVDYYFFIKIPQGK